MRRAMLVKSDKITGESVRGYLIDMGYNVVVVSSAPEAIEKYHRDRSYDLVIIEMELPGVNGTSAAKLIRQMQMAKRPVIVGFSADELHSQPALEAGMDFFMVTHPPGKRNIMGLAVRNAAREGGAVCQH